MTADEKISKLKEQIRDLEEEYCKNCQEWDCDNCWAKIEE